MKQGLFVTFVIVVVIHVSLMVAQFVYRYRELKREGK
jgi:hypothetical protein